MWRYSKPSVSENRRCVCVCLAGALEREKLVKIIFRKHQCKCVKRKKKETQLVLKVLRGGMWEENGTVALPHGWSVGLAGGRHCQHSPQWGSSGGGRTQPWHCSWYHMVPLREWQPLSSASVPDWVEIMANCTRASPEEPEPTDMLRPDLEHPQRCLENCQNRIFKQYETEW